MTETQPTAALVQRVLPAPPDAVFAEWIDPEALAEWMCPRPARATHIELDARVGGLLRLDIVDDETEMVVTGRFLALDRPNHLQFTWTCSTWPTESSDSVVTVTLQPHGGDATLMTIRHTLVPPDQVANHQHGWEQIGAQLAQQLRISHTH
ncbi:MAG TPA: SRPBCC family protein [Acidimicrobiia bacterium]|nr:SRPBCC family protein [Acidimicrobiia bacterium]